MSKEKKEIEYAVCEYCGNMYEEGDYCIPCQEEYISNHTCIVCNGLYDQHEDFSMEEPYHTRVSIIKEFGFYDDYDYDDYLYRLCESCYEKMIKPIFENGKMSLFKRIKYNLLFGFKEKKYQIKNTYLNHKIKELMKNQDFWFKEYEELEKEYKNLENKLFDTIKNMIIDYKVCDNCGKIMKITNNIETSDAYRKTIDEKCVCFLCSEMSNKLPSLKGKYKFKKITL